MRRPDVGRLPKLLRRSDDISPGETLIGLLGLIVLAAICYGIVWVFSKGAPASGLCLLALFGWMVLLSIDAMAELDKRAKRGTVSARIVKSLMDDASRGALWTGIGLALIWLVQVVLFRSADLSGPEHVADVQLSLYDLADRIKGAFSPIRFAAIVGGALLLSLVLGETWPVTFTALSRKWLGRVAAVVIAATSMTFVAVDVGTERYQQSLLGPIAARMQADLTALRTARQEHAALQWVRASVQRTIASPDDARAWQDYLKGAAQMCEAANGFYGNAFTGGVHFGLLPSRRYCDRQEFLAVLVHDQVRLLNGAATVQADPALWLDNFADLRPYEATGVDEGQPDIRIGDLPSRLSSLKTLRQRLGAALADEKGARDALEGAVTGMLTSLVGGDDRGMVADIVKALKNEVVKAIVRDGRERVGLWLTMRNVPLSKTARVLLIEPALRLESPKKAIGAAGGVAALVRQRFAAYHESASLSEIAVIGRRTASANAAMADGAARARTEVERWVRESKWKYERGRGRR